MEFTESFVAETLCVIRMQTDFRFRKWACKSKNERWASSSMWPKLHVLAGLEIHNLIFLFTTIYKQQCKLLSCGVFSYPPMLGL